MLFLKTKMSAGHGGKTGRFEILKDKAEEYCFLIKAFEWNFYQYDSFPKLWKSLCLIL